MSTLLADDLIAESKCFLIGPCHISCILHFGDLYLELFCKHPRCSVEGFNLSIIILPLQYAVQIFIIHMKMILVPLVLYPQHDQQAAGHSQCEAGSINEGECFVFPEIPPGS